MSVQVLFLGVGGGLFWGIRGMMAGGIAACFFSCFALMSAVSCQSHITVKDQLAVFVSPVIWSLLTAGVLCCIKLVGLSLWGRFLVCGVAGAGMLALSWYFMANKSRGGKHDE